MRAWTISRALAGRYSVSFWVPGPDGLPPVAQLPPNVHAIREPSARTLASRIRTAMHHYRPAWYPGLYREPEDWPRSVALPSKLAARHFDRVHVFRHSMVPFAAPFLGTTACQLDLDESECRTRGRISQLYNLNGQVHHAGLLRHEAEFFAEEEHNLRNFETLFVSSEPDRQHLESLGLTVRLLPNTIPVPARPAAPPSASGPPTLLLVGNLNYYPNEDAARFLTGDIVPLLRARRPNLRVRIAGHGPSRLRGVLASNSAVDWLGFVPDLKPLFDTAHVVVVPIRAGGGTRIKILEAFSHCRAVVSTATGAEGLEAEDGTHLLEGESPEQFAAACLRLLDDSDLRDRIALAGYQLASARYSSDMLDAAI